MMKGKLTLVPTPLYEETQLESVALHLLMTHALSDKVIIAVEEHREARRRWLKWGLPRESIERFILFNEHTQKELARDLIKEMNLGKEVYLLSDGGMPAFCDPGIELVRLCHENKIQVTATPFPNSPILALALSGFDSDQFVFQGFLPLKSPEREQKIRACLTEKRTQILMDTPYRLQQVLADFKNLMEPINTREVCMAIDLSSPSEKVICGRVDAVSKALEFTKKAEFIFLLNAR